MKECRPHKRAIGKSEKGSSWKIDLFFWLWVHRRHRWYTQLRLGEECISLKYIYTGRTVVCLSENKPPRTADSTDLFQVSTKRPKEQGIPHIRGRGTSRGQSTEERSQQREKCRVLRSPHPGRTCGDPAGREIEFHCRRERQLSANHHVKTFRPRMWAQRRPASRTTVSPWPRLPVPVRLSIPPLPIPPVAALVATAPPT